MEKKSKSKIVNPEKCCKKFKNSDERYQYFFNEFNKQPAMKRLMERLSKS